MIGKLHDDISNTQSSIVGKWTFDSKIYRENPASSGGRTPEQMYSSSLCTINFSERAEFTYCIVGNNCTTLRGDMLRMLDSKLQSIWLLRQSIRGDGRVYDINHGKYTLKTANAFIQGGYKGLLIQIDIKTDLQDAGNQQTHIANMHSLLAGFNLNGSIDSLAYSDAELAKLYAQVLQGRKL